MMMEHMNRGTVAHLSERGLINLEGLAAVVRQIGSALAFMHKSACVADVFLSDPEEFHSSACLAMPTAN